MVTYQVSARELLKPREVTIQGQPPQRRRNAARGQRARRV